MIRTIPAREIKRRGIGAVDEMLCDGPVHVIRNDEPTYVILTEARFREMVEELHEAWVQRVKLSIAEYESGQYTRADSVAELLATLGFEDVASIETEDGA